MSGYTVIPDISAHQGSIDIDTFCAGNQFAVFRARVNGKDDAKFQTWARELVQRGFPFAVYDYVRLKSVDDAVVQAEAMYNVASPFSPTIYYLDTEELADGVSYEQERKYITAYVATLRRLGVQKIGQYTSDYYWRTQYRSIEPLFDTLWIAAWGVNDGTYYGQTIRSEEYTDKIDLHQYTSFGYTRAAGVPGIEHRIDLNRLTGKRPLEYFTGGTENSFEAARHEGFVVVPSTEATTESITKTNTGGETEVAKKQVIIGSARIDEDGKAKGGKPGDQNGREVSTQAWYKHEKGWRVFRCVDPAAAIKIGDAMESACANRCIGYDQGDRLTLYNAARPYGFDPAQVQKDVECDCSSLVRVCVAYAGISTPNFNTTTEANALLNTGRFRELTGAEYTASPDRLCRGDILCTRTQGHTVVVLTDGALADRGDEDKDDNVAPDDPAIDTNGYVRTVGSYWLRTKPSTITGKKIEAVVGGSLVRVYGEINGWYGVKVMASGNKGYISGKAIPK